MAIIRKLLIALVVLIVILGIAGFFLTRGDTAELSVDEVAGIDPTLEEPDPDDQGDEELADNSHA
ncbi:MAG: hypothetical protein AAGL68_11865, partial [Pseudomonadota bacterium]